MDAIIELREAKRRLTLFAEVKHVDRATTLATLKERLAPFDGAGILIAPYLTPELAERCRQLDLQFMDAAGNAYVRAPGLYVFIKGEKRPPHVTPIGARGAGTATAVRVVFALLCRPDLLNAPYREIVDATGVALGTVGAVLIDLETRGYITPGTRRRNRRMLQPKRLLEEWVTNFPIKLRRKLNPRRFRAPDPNWWKATQLPEGAYWGGEVAADRLTGYLKPETFTIYVDPGQGREILTALVVANRLRADPKGEVEVLDTFWRFELGPRYPDLVPPVLIYADLMATLDPRNLQVAKLVRERFIDDAPRQP